MSNITDIVKKITKANSLYRTGDPIISDREYDKLIDELKLIDPTNKVLSSVGYSKNDDRKSKLPIEMASMDKLKTIEEIKAWTRVKGIDANERCIITPKLDGLSLCIEEFSENSWTRGDGTEGQKSNEHYKSIGNHSKAKSFEYTYGEVIMPKKTFSEKYMNDFANPRNLVAGLLNSKEIKDALKDCHYIKYGGVGGDFSTKKDLLDELNKSQKVKIDYEFCKLSELTEEMLIHLFHKWSIDYEIDGIIIEVDNLKLQEELGRETSSKNPVYARAFKHESFTQSATTEVVGITWGISKNGLLKPVLHVKPIRLDGVIVSNVTGNNAKYLKDNMIGLTSKVLVIRSGSVIPKIVGVLTRVEFEMPCIDGVEIGWNENGVELITLTETDDQKIKKNISFFEILGAKNIGEGVISQLWEHGYKTIKEILNLSISDLEKIDGFGKRKSQIVYSSIQNCISDVELSKLQHASGIFTGLGSKKLVLLEHFKTKPTIEQIVNIDGFADSSAMSYLDGYDDFFEFIKDMPIKIKKDYSDLMSLSSDLNGNVYVFTGCRLTDCEKIIESRGGKISSGVSKNTTHLIVKSIGSGSSKEMKAMELGIKIMSSDELVKSLK